jgi:hypothetical protein
MVVVEVLINKIKERAYESVENYIPKKKEYRN